MSKKLIIFSNREFLRSVMKHGNLFVSRALVVSKYPSDLSLSTGRVWNAARIFLKQCLFHVEMPCTNWVFSMVKLAQICHFWKEPKPCFFSQLVQSHLNSLSKVNCWIIKHKSLFVFWLDYTQRYYPIFMY